MGKRHEFRGIAHVGPPTLPAGAELPPHIRSLADYLVNQRTIDTWMRVDRSQNYIMRLLAANRMRSAQQEISAESTTQAFPFIGNISLNPAGPCAIRYEMGC